MSLLSAIIFRHGYGHHGHRIRLPSVAMHPNLTYSVQQHSMDDDVKHRPAIKYALQHHRKYHSHPHPPLIASASTSILWTTSSTPHHLAHHHQQHQHQRLIPQPHHQHQSTKYYHTTSKKEIVPFLIIGGFVGLTAVYAYKTFQQIDADWENYYKAVEEYKSKTGIDLEAGGKNDGAQQSQMDAAAAAAAAMGEGAAMNSYLSTFFTGGILAIDVGTRRVKLSHRPRPSSSSSSSSSASYADQRTNSTHPSITVDREGYRYTPSLVWLPPPSSFSPNDNGNENEVLSGRLAEARLYDVKDGQTIPLQGIILDSSSTEENGGDDQTTTNRAAISQSIRNVACNALDQVLGGGSSIGNGRSSNSGTSSLNNNKYPLFVLDASLSNLSGSYNVRPIFTYPTTPNTIDGKQQNYYVEQLQKAISDLTSPVGIASYVPEPIAIVAGAEYFNLLPPMDTTTSSSVLVVDVGGTTTCVSLVRGGGGGDKKEEEILYSTSLPFGGDTFIDVLVSHLIDDFYGQQRNDRNEDDPLIAGSKTSTLSTRPKLNDPTALQRLHEASTTTIHELSNKSRSEINVPYLTMDMTTRQPRHLKLGMSRNVVNGEVETWIRNKLVPHLMKKQENNPSMSVLSQATPPPTNLASLFSSTIMCALEQTSHTPFMLRAILVVGGGARIPLVREAMKEGVGYLAGEAYAVGSGGKGKRLIMPEGEMCDELGVLGAAVWGSSR
ncbi:hypothetical protein ACHAWU_002499 [Discostella pseudostelligera]|uniref:Actin-like ATPase domain-containing protein n=1 Tax=Discostella pseudostelligera TaxID=259834 RepID=A0ABD3M5G4_9STRA